MDAANPGMASSRGRNGPEAAASVVLGGVLAFLCAWASLGLVRETLHYNCSWGIGGEWGPDGTWVCADGIGYIFPPVALGGLSGTLLLIGLAVAFIRPSTGRSVTYLILATIALTGIGLLTLYAATLYTGSRPEGETGAGVWVASVLPGLAVCTLGLLAGTVGALAPWRWRTVLLWTGIGLMLIGSTLQPGIGVLTLTATGMLAAGGVGRRLPR